jgi:hypothetical protein
MHLWKFHGRRLALAVAALGAAGALAGTASFALFTSAATQETDTFAAGTVILEQTTMLPPCVFTDGGTYTGRDNTGVQAMLNPMEPGDSATCTYSLTYAGNLNAWVALGLSVSSVALQAYTPAGSLTQIGGEALLNDSSSVDSSDASGHDANGLQLTISAVVKDGASGTTGASQTISLPPLTCTNIGASGATEGSSGYQEQCTSGSNEVYSLLFDNANPGNNTNADPANSWTPNTTATITVTASLPLSAGNAYQGSSAQITLSGEAVQASNNPLGGSNLPCLGFNETPVNACTSGSGG